MGCSVAPTGELRGLRSRTDGRPARWSRVARLWSVAHASTFLAAAELRAKSLAVRAALGLPEPVQRVLAGPRVAIDGQTLATDTQLLLRLEKLAREPEVATLPVPDGRRTL